MTAQIDCNGKILDLNGAVVMGILNITPDSFYPGSRFPSEKELLLKAELMLSEGAAILDIGAVSTRPGAAMVSAEEELTRIIPAVKTVTKHFPEAIISVDTFRAEVAGRCVQEGAGIVNDIYAGRHDRSMIPTVVHLKVPMILMHMQGTPADMQVAPAYIDVVKEVYDFFRDRISQFPENFTGLILDPGFGFGKSVEHNFLLLNNFEKFQHLGFPLLAGLSRKSMIQRPLKIKSDASLNGTTVLNTVALLKGARILRVHDVREAAEAIHLIRLLGEAV